MCEIEIKKRVVCAFAHHENADKRLDEQQKAGPVDLAIGDGEAAAVGGEDAIKQPQSSNHLLLLLLLVLLLLPMEGDQRSGYAGEHRKGVGVRIRRRNDNVTAENAQMNVDEKARTNGQQRRHLVVVAAAAARVD